MARGGDDHVAGGQLMPDNNFGTFALVSDEAQWVPTDSRAACLEGWDVWDSAGSDDGPFQIQFLAEPELLDLGYTAPKFDGDTDAWVHVREQALVHHSELHQRALLFIEHNNSLEYARVMLWPIVIDCTFAEFDPTDYVNMGPFKRGRCDGCGLGLTLDTTHDEDACIAKGPQRHYWES